MFGIFGEVARLYNETGEYDIIRMTAECSVGSIDITHLDQSRH